MLGYSVIVNATITSCGSENEKFRPWSWEKRMQIRRSTALVAIILALLNTARDAQAQLAGAAWKPAGNVEFVVGAGAGGENDRIARAIQRALTKERLVELMTVLNRPGAGQIIAMNYLAGKKGDANAIGLASGSFINAIARNGSILNKQLTPLIKLFDAYQCYFTNIDSQFKNMADVRDRLKADPTSVTFAFPVGLGSPLHISVVNVGKAVGAPPSKLVTVVFEFGVRRCRAGGGQPHRCWRNEHW